MGEKFSGIEEKLQESLYEVLFDVVPSKNQYIGLKDAKQVLKYFCNDCSEDEKNSGCKMKKSFDGNCAEVERDCSSSFVIMDVGNYGKLTVCRNYSPEGMFQTFLDIQNCRTFKLAEVVFQLKSE